MQKNITGRCILVIKLNKIGYKSSLDVEQLEGRIKNHAQRLEIQLLDDFVINSHIDNYVELIKYAKNLGLNIYSIHLPIINEGMELQNINNKFYKDIFLRTCMLSEEAGNIFDNNILVILHTGWGLEEFKTQENILINVKNTIKQVLLEYPHVLISLENEIPVTYDKHKKCHTRYNFAFGNVTIANYLKNELGTDKIGTTLDTAHAIVAERYVNILKSFGHPMDNITLEQFFAANKDTIQNMHLAYVKNLGYLPRTHGITFTEKTKGILKSIIEYYENYNLEANITIEVIEDDYKNINNALQTTNYIKEIIYGKTKRQV